MTELAAAVAEAMGQVRADLERLVRIPSIAFEEFPEEPVVEAAEATREILEAAGVANAELIDIPGGPPAVFGVIDGPPGSPTVLLYAHYDVQPAGHEGEWTSPPWEPTERDGRLYGRGTADDKCGVAIHAGALRALGGAAPATIKVIIEGEEETGRGTFSEYVQSNPERLAADVIVVADGGNWRVGEPTLTTSLRGLCALDVEVRTLESNVHSGLFGGPTPDAMIALARMLATLHDDIGDVAVQGLVSQPWDGRSVDEQDLRSSSALLDGVQLIGSGSLAERLYMKPSITAIGIDMPSVATAANALIAVARARISARLAPGQDPSEAAELIAAHLSASAPWGVRVTITPHEMAPGAMLVGGGAFGSAAEAAMAQAYGKPPVKVGSGGAIPLCVTLARTYPDAEIILWGACDDSAHIHSADESVDLGDLERATLAEALFLAGLS